MTCSTRDPAMTRIVEDHRDENLGAIRTAPLQ